MTQTQLNHKTLRSPRFRAWLGVLFGTLIIVSVLIMSLSSAPTANAGINGSTAASITVNTFADEDVDNGSCSLREAIVAANSDTAYQGCSAGSGTDVITVPAGTYTLNDQLPGVNSTITIDGNNAVVQADANPNTATYRLFEVLGSGGNLTLNFLTLQNGNCPNALSCSGPNSDSDKGKGGAIFNSGILTVNDSIIKNNTSSSTGGGIFLQQGTLTVLNTVFENNNAASGNGGGIGTGGSGSISVTTSTFSNNNSIGGGGISSGSSNNPVTVTGSTFSGNSGGSGFGGGIGSSGNLDVRTSTFFNNTAGNGAGLSNSYGGSLSQVSNSTFYGNTATGKGGGIYNDADLTLTNNTFSQNSAPTGGGFYNDPYKRENENIFPVVTLKNTILANSTSGSDCFNFVNGAIKPVLGNNNLIESDSADDNACGTTAPINGNDPLLGTLTGSPAYYPLLAGSPAINAGSDSNCAAAPVSNTSQNGVTRPKSTHCDIGSYEANVAGTPTAYVVNSNADHDDGACDVFGTGTGFQDCTLREAITLANANIATDTITFSLSSLITLGAPLPAIDDDVTIDGAGNTPAPTIDGASAYQVFTINNGKTLNLHAVIISHGMGAACGAESDAGGGICNDGGTLNAVGIEMSLNKAAGKGGAIYNNGGTVDLYGAVWFNEAQGGGGAVYNNGGTVTVYSTLFQNNVAANGGGGALHNNAGTVNVDYTTFLLNEANNSGSGGAIQNTGSMSVTRSLIDKNSAGIGGGVNNWGTMSIANSTIYSNTAYGPGGLGGGIENYGTLSVVNSTISDNNAYTPGNPTNGLGGGIDHESGTLELINSIVANSINGGDCAGTTGVTGSNNLIEGTGFFACGFTNGVDGNIIGVDPLLGTLVSYSMALLPGSPAIDAGNDAVCAAAPINGFDFNGVTRPQGAHCDIGAVEAVAGSPTATPTASGPTSTPTASGPTSTPTASGPTSTPTASGPTSTPTATSTTLATATAIATSTSTPNTAVFQVLGVSPNEGFNNQPVNIVITGAAFVGTPQIFLGNTTLQNVVRDSNTQLRATVPAGQTPGTYDLIVINGNGSTALLAQSYTVRTTEPTISLVQPSAGISDFPNNIGIYGFNFANGAEVKLGDTVLDSVFVNGSFLQATVPADLTAGTYNITVRNPNNSSVTKIGAYQVYPTLNNDDLYANGYEIWTDPVAPRAAGATKVGLIIHRQGGKTTLSNVTARFYQGDPQNGGILLGNGTIDLLSVRTSETTSAVNWTPAAPGSYTLWAVIDPDGLINESIEANNVVSRTLTVLPPAPDGVPPRVESFSINDGATKTTQQTVFLDASASDAAPSSGLKSILYKEFEYNQNTAQWLPIKISGWLDYESNRNNKSWELAPASGLKYMQAWAADNAGNIALFPFKGYINYIPSSERVGTDQTRSYFFTLTAGQRLTARVTPSSGDPDLFVWSPDPNAPPYVSNLSGGVEEVSFIASVGGVYQVEVYGYAKADYQLAVDITTGAAARTGNQMGGEDPNKPKPSSPVIPRSDQGPGTQQGLPTAPTAPVTAPVFKIYLPVTIR